MQPSPLQKRKQLDADIAEPDSSKETKTEAHVPLDRLPPEILIRILRVLRLQDVLRVSEACTTLRDVARDPHLRFEVQLSVTKSLRTQLDGAVRLGVRLVSLTAAGLKGLAMADAPFLRACPNLTFLDLSDVSRLTGRIFLEIATLPNLETLLLRSFPRVVSQAEVRALVTGCPRLRHLDMCQAPMLRANELSPLADLTALETLELASTMVGITRWLYHCSALTALDLSVVRFPTIEAPPEEVSLPRLRKFRAMASQFFFPSVAALLRNSIDTLTSLHLAILRAEEILPHLAHATSLTSLNMSTAASLTDEALQPFLESRGSQLRVLSLCQTRIEGTCIVNAVNLGHTFPHLRCAMFSQSRISEAACQALLAVAPNMEYFEVSAARNVSRESRAKWALQFPNWQGRFKADLTFGANV